MAFDSKNFGASQWLTGSHSYPKEIVSSRLIEGSDGFETKQLDGALGLLAWCRGWKARRMPGFATNDRYNDIDMSRFTDLQWFQANRAQLAAKYAGRWIVVHDKAVRADFALEEEAVGFAVEQFGIDVASVFLAAARDPVSFVGAMRL